VNSWAKHPLRVSRRLLWLVGEIVLAALNYARRCAFRSPSRLPIARAAWLQQSSKRALRIFQIETRVAGRVPKRGLLVCNHLSYVDILVLAALTPCRFVSKSEVKKWPVFGWFARLSGTIFVERNKRLQAARAADEIAVALRQEVLVVLFPEGTSSGGETVLPFKSSLLEPAARTLDPVTAGLIRYDLADGDVSEEVCYWKDMTLVPHLINLLSKPHIKADLHFTRPKLETKNRKAIARQLHSDLVRLRTALSLNFSVGGLRISQKNSRASNETMRRLPSLTHQPEF
jgi:1-acyl-sn-glycerol-3-phosphate acyltransferase